MVVKFLTSREPRDILYRKVLIWVMGIGAALIVSLLISKPKTVDFSSHLSETAVTVDGEEIPLKTLGYYVMVTEENVDLLASLYDPSDTFSFWRLHINTTFVVSAAKKGAMNTCIRDILYSNRAVELGISLDDDDEEKIMDEAADIEDGLSMKQRMATQLDAQSLVPILERVYLARKYAVKLSEEMDFTTEYGQSAGVALGVGGAYFEEAYEAADIKINEKLWKKVSLGNITIGHYE